VKAVLLAGGFGTRIGEESHLKPKPMIEIGGRPILWHIMKIYSVHGINDFVICLGYKGLVAYLHRGFWHAMDTLRDKTYLDEVWSSGKAPWKIWP